MMIYRIVTRTDRGFDYVLEWDGAKDCELDWMELSNFIHQSMREYGVRKYIVNSVTNVNMAENRYVFMDDIPHN